MQATQREQIQEAFESAINAGTSQNVLARKIGISASTIINIRRSNWEDISDRMENRIAAYFKMDGGWPLHNTWNLKAITRLCDEAKSRARFLGVVGYTGAGKSKALTYYAHHNKNTFYVLCDVTMSRRTFLHTVQRAMGLGEFVSIPQIMNRIVGKLNGLEKPLLILDDAGKLTHTVMRLIQLIYDRTEHRAGLVIAGTEFLKDEIDKQAARNKLGFRELRRRVGYWQPLQLPSAKVITEICTHHGITDENAINYVIEHAEDYGTLHNIVTNAKYMAETQGRLIDRKLMNDLAVGDHAYNYYKHAKK